METKSYSNPYSDYSAASELFIKNGALVQSLSDKVDNLLEQLITDLSKTLQNFTCRGEHSVYTGYTGIAMFIMYSAVKRNDKRLMKLALEKCEMAAYNLKNVRVCFLNGDGGPLALCAVIMKLFEYSKDTKKYADRLLQLNNVVLSDENMPDEILYGRAGYLFALLFANKHLGDDLICPEVVRNVAEKILQSGRQLSLCRKSRVPLEYEWHNKNYLGAAHGVAGILYVLLLAHKTLTEYELNGLIRPTLDWLLEKHRFEGGNFESSVGSRKDRLVQWCHGAPGFVHLLLLASTVFNEEKYNEAAIKCGEVIWQRGLLSKGYSLCHGVSGNAYSFLQLYKVTKDLKYWHRAACFADWCTKCPKNQGIIPDRPDSLFEGKAGMAYFLLEIKEPLESSFPGFDL